MRETSPELDAALTGPHGVSSAVAVYYDGEPVLDELPIAGGALEYDGTQDVPGSPSLEFPRFYTDPDTGQRLDLLPGSASSPLDCEGTQLAITYTVNMPGAGAEVIGLGWYRIASWDEGIGTVNVSCTSLEALIQEARFLNPATVATGQNYAVAANALVGGLLPLSVTADAAKVATGQAFEEDRLAALRDLVTAWPASMVVDDAGTLVIAPPYDDANDPIVAVLTDGEGGTVVQAPTSGNRDGVYNAVKATGETTGDTAPVSAIAYLTTGPRAWNSPYGNVPYFYSSPLLSTASQARAAATTRLHSLQATASSVTIEASPDPRYQVGDVIELRQAGRRTRILRIDSLSLPLTAAGGAMTITGHEVDR